MSKQEKVTAEQMLAYCKYRKLRGIKGTFIENNIGVFMIVNGFNRPNEKHFSHVKQNTSGTYIVRVNKEDYENYEITDNKLTEVKGYVKPDTEDYIY